MTLLNADGSPSELSGNGLRGLAAIVARDWQRAGRGTIARSSSRPTAGLQALALEEVSGASYLFAAEMGQPDRHRRARVSTCWARR